MIDWIARRIWWSILWIMRRPGIKRLQWRSIEWLPARMRPRARENLIRQNRFARRYGIALLRLSLLCFFASLTFVLATSLVGELMDRGIFPLRQGE